MLKKLFKKMRQFRSLLWFTAILLLAVYIVFGHKYKVIYNVGHSMDPYHSHQEWLILESVNPNKDWVPDKYDVVVFHKNGDRLTKRVIGLPGDTIEIRDGYIYLNNRQLPEHGNFGNGRISYTLVDDNDEELRYWSGPQTGEVVIKYGEAGPFVVPKGHFWAIGDNRSMSWYGLGKIEDIIGVSLL